MAASIFDPQRLRVARQLRKLTRADLARKVGVSAAAVGQWEAADIRPRAQTLLDVSDALDFPIQYFATSGRTISNLDSDCTFFPELAKVESDRPTPPWPMLRSSQNSSP